MKSYSQQITAAYRKFSVDWVLPNGRCIEIVSYKEALEIARSADKEIAELKLRLALLENA